MKQTLFVTIKLHFALHQTWSFMKESNTLRLVFTLLEALRLGIYVTSLVHMTNILQFEGEC